MNFDAYDPQSFYDDYFAATGKLRPELAPILEWFQSSPSQDMPQIKHKLEGILKELGATLSFEGEEERVLPFDPVPRVITAEVQKKSPCRKDICAIALMMVFKGLMWFTGEAAKICFLSWI